VTESPRSSTTVTPGDAPQPEPPADRVPMLSAPAISVRRSGWTPGRITAFVIGALLVLVSVGKLVSGAVVLWAGRYLRDSGYVTTNVRAFSTNGAALATEPVELGSPGVGWLYSRLVLGEVRIRVTSVSSGAALFVGIGPSAAVDRYLAGVNHTSISDFWTNKMQTIDGGAPGSAPGTDDFWVASSTGTGPRTLTWVPTNGSWSLVVMNADGRPRVDVRADLGATMPALRWIGVALLMGGVLFFVVGVLLMVGATRRSRARGLGRADRTEVIASSTGSDRNQA
jgi:hypothetical protein